MSAPLAVTLEARVLPFERPIIVRAVITNPPAVASDSYLGGFASGRRLTYLDAQHFVWWTPDTLPGEGS